MTSDVSSIPNRPRHSVVAARLPAAAVLFVCRACAGGDDMRREFKRAIAASGNKRRLRAVASGCLDICPKRGTAAVVVRTGCGARCIVVGEAVPVDADLVETLLDEGVRDSVTDQQRFAGASVDLGR